MTAQTLKEWREQVLNGILYGSLIVGTLTLAVGIATTLRDKRPDLLLIYLAAYAILILIGFRRTLGFIVRAAALLALLFALGLVDLVEVGLSGDGRVFLFTFVVIAAVLFDLKHSIVALITSLLTMGGGRPGAAYRPA